MFNQIGSTELLMLAAILLLLFGGKKLPELARGIGDSLKEFRKAAKETE
jgi:sec-independent protein translocase protein TatA